MISGPTDRASVIEFEEGHAHVSVAFALGTARCFGAPPMDLMREAQAGLAADAAGPGALAAMAGSAGRRGPGQSGSARPLPGESGSRAAAFGTGLVLDVMPACPDLALLAGAAAGDDDAYEGASDDELTGVLCAWDRLEAHMAARKLAAVPDLKNRALAVAGSG